MDEPAKPALPDPDPTMKFFRPLCGGLLAALSCQPAAGQTARPEPPAPAGAVPVPLVLSPFEVTSDRDETEYRANHAASSNRFNTSLFDTPQSVTVLTEAFLRDLEVVDIVEEALIYVPGVARGEYGNGGESNITIRGQPVPEVLHDNMPALYTNVRPDSAIIQRVEVIKGSSSSLYGSSWPGGIVNMMTKRPLENRRTDVTVQMGSHDFFRTVADATGPLNKRRTLRYRLIGAFEDSGSFRDGVNNDRITLFPALSYVFRPGTQAGVSFEYLHSRQTADPHLPILAGQTQVTLPRERFLGLPDRDFEVHKRSLRAFFDHRLAEHWALRFNYVGSDITSDKDGAQLTGTANAVTRRQARRVNRQFIVDETHAAQVDVLGRAALGPVTLRTLIGADFQKRPWRDLATTAQNLTPNFVDVDRPGYTYTLSGAPIALNRNTSKTASYGGYVQNQASVLRERLQVIFGYRLDGMTQESTSLTLPAPVEYTPPNVVTPRYAILFRPMERLSLYATYGESFRFETSGRPIFGTDRRLDPTTGVLYEVGAKSRFFDGRLNVDLEVFELSREGIVVGDPDHPGFVLQTGLERAEGYAVSFSTDPLPGRLTLSGGYGYTDGKVVRDLNPALVGKPLRGSPKHSWTIFAKYRVTTGPLKGLGAGLGAQYSDVQYGPTNQNFSAPAHTVFNAQLNYAWRRYSFNVVANNLFDEVYWRPGGNNGNRAGDPLTFRGSIRARF